MAIDARRMVGSTAWSRGFLAADNATTARGLLNVSAGTGHLNLLDYAEGDGVTDDTAGFQAAIDAANTLGMPLYVPGTANGYKISAVLTGYSNLTIFGEGYRSRIIQTHVKSNVLDFYSKTNVVLRDLHFQANGNFDLDSNPGQAYCGLHFEDCTTIQIRNCTFTKSAYAGMYLSRCSRFIVYGNDFPDPGWKDPYSKQQQTGDIGIDDSHDGLVTLNVCHSTGTYAGGIGIAVNGGLKEALLGGAHGSGDAYNIMITGNFVKRKTFYGIMAYNQGPPSNTNLTNELYGIIVEGNFVENVDGSYHHVAEGATYDHSRITEGTAAGDGIYMQSPFRSICRNNVIKNCGLFTRSAGTHVKAGIGWGGTPDGMAVGNYVENCYYGGIVFNNSALQGDLTNLSPKISNNVAKNCGAYVGTVTLTSGSSTVTLAAPTKPLEPAQAANCLGGFWIGDKVTVKGAGAAGADLEATVTGLNATLGTLTLSANSSLTGSTVMALSDASDTPPSTHFAIGAVMVQRIQITDNQVIKDSTFDLGARSSSIVVQGASGGADAMFLPQINNNYVKGGYTGIKLVNTTSAQVNNNLVYGVTTDAIQSNNTAIRSQIVSNRLYNCGCAININSGTEDALVANNYGECNKGIDSNGNERLENNDMTRCTTAYPNNKPGVRTVTNSYTVLNRDDLVLVDATGGAVIITLPAAAWFAGKKITVKKIDATANNVILDGNGGETIDGAGFKTIATQWGTVKAVSNGSGWFTV